MSFLTATNTELIYNMTAASADLASTTATIFAPSAGEAAYLPPVFSIWQPSSIVGKGFRVCFGGTYDAGAVALTLKYSLDTTQGTQLTSNPGVIASTGAFTVPSIAAGGFDGYFDIIFTASSVAGNLSGYVSGLVAYGQGNNAAAANANVAMIGGSSNGATTATFTTWPGATAFFWELQATWGTAPTHSALTKHQIFGLN
jgi:hypothetical protein